jgi:hypothetical protein
MYSRSTEKEKVLGVKQVEKKEWQPADVHLLELLKSTIFLLILLFF